MTGNKEALPRAKSKGLEKGIVDGRNQHLHDTQNPRFQQYRDDPEAYRRAVRRLFADAYVMAQDFPARLRFSYVVDRNGKLRPLSNGEVLR
jgi:hypothetical protein